MSETDRLSDEQALDLARPLVGIITKFYEDPEMEKGFQQWLTHRQEKDVSPKERKSS